MQNISDLFGQADTGFEINGSVPGLKVIGGPYGFTPDFRNQLNWHSYIQQPLINILLAAPGFFNLLPNPEIFQGTLKDLIELNAKQTVGLRSTVNVEYAQTELSRAGEFWEDVSMAKRERSEPTYTFVERMFKPVNKFLEFWISWGIQDPEAGIPLVSTLPGVEKYRLVSSNTSMVTMHIEPDPTHTEVVHSYLVFNQQPKTGGVVEGERNIFTGKQVLEYQIPFTATTMVGYSVNKLAQKLLNELELIGANPSSRELFIDGISADIAGITQTGYKEAVNLISQEQTR